MSFPKYPEYKDSGIEWLGEVPAHWQVLPLKAQFQVVGGSTPSPDEEHWGGQVTWVTPADLSSLPSLEVGASSRQITKKGLASCGATLVPSGSLVLSTRAPIGSLAIASVPLCTNQGCKSLVPANGKEARFFAYLLRNCTEALNVRGKGTTFLELSGDELSSFKVTVPPQNEQATISNFLDHETARIDALVEEQQRLIELLKEKRQAVISHAVTKGLDPDVPMKDSGVEWLGEVPVHWEVGKIKWYISTTSGGTPPSSQQEEFYGGEVPWLRSLDLNDGHITEYEVSVTERALKETSCRMVPKGSVLIAMYGGDGTIGKNGLLTFNSAINQAVCAFLPDGSFFPEYLHRYLQFYRPYWMIGAESSRKDPNIGQDRVGDSYCLLPPIEEQKVVVNQLNTELDVMAQLQAEAEDLVSRLQERRSALISAAVTGKIDVRGWQPPVGSSPPR